MISLAPRPVGRRWGTISFASTLYLYPVLDLLLSEVPRAWRAEVRLGLQEALVNAAKHGNNLDPSKTVLVNFLVTENHYWWVISDQGPGFSPPACCQADADEHLPHHEGECGRGLFILHQIFDQVHWSTDGTQLRLGKQLRGTARVPKVR
ncbi:anti-sigma regulatory factor [Geitlerinema sp. PCC 7407]|uniref:ATP-binding protein n=1 Tax=Geitlerinema sp. PCC 7407 TaxID=1173025 RepID=UPI00029FF315|nr:anti-sigma regulatory factor [Geitlerinema sp. PCC 7407]AFY68188.1 putative anti-sigma regulatory factor, serine/threonine protein kinase [Geitlerinema sp. PCC 7407]